MTRAQRRPRRSRAPPPLRNLRRGPPIRRRRPGPIRRTPPACPPPLPMTPARAQPRTTPGFRAADLTRLPRASHRRFQRAPRPRRRRLRRAAPTARRGPRLRRAAPTAQRTRRPSDGAGRSVDTRQPDRFRATPSPDRPAPRTTLERRALDAIQFRLRSTWAVRPTVERIYLHGDPVAVGRLARPAYACACCAVGFPPAASVRELRPHFPASPGGPDGIGSPGRNSRDADRFPDLPSRSDQR
jgi:hypothetical protein